ncbi:hypothetical protein C0J52_24163 [Blattella germanica]|nr:hypothetical protein C0J52_24163 [Blattella germanica]PSN39226.1 hypothetical protein C0J52_24163 [Blattella germanica]PSN39227.1 hypothetical protein C0J52_24163 [Blattella germanica]PSN39228.1 hypothetical protein C0J52_24163 [Blattella germanica]PSN39229.1 hypothetical protein C0J52_24163 [Blattella germanica]
MAAARLTIEQRKSIPKWFIKFDNAVEVQRQWRREFETEPPTRLTIKRIIDKFEMCGTICNIHKGKSGKADVIFYQQDGAPPHYHLAVRAFLDDNLQGHWIGERGPLSSLHCRQILHLWISTCWEL